MRAFLLTYSQQCPDWRAQAIMNQTNAVKTWVQPFPSAAIVVSDLDVTDLGAVLQSRFGGTWFLVTEIAADTVQGFLPGNLWQFIAALPRRRIRRCLSTCPIRLGQRLESRRRAHATQSQPRDPSVRSCSVIERSSASCGTAVWR